ncbi:MAG: radical SAM protein [Patescibacteria group bacterium]|nr:radical SAM protein [Patescibacteria group bacterium]MCL5261991.1 radical SAM protein [Patescibacteria group bacterium]
MCSNPAEFNNPRDSRAYGYNQLIKRIEDCADRLFKSRESINLTGGEPTIVPQFVQLLNWIRKEFPDNEIVCVSNGRMFAYDDFAKKVLAVENLKLEIAMHGHTPALYDEITGVKGGFPQAVQGLKNILRFRNDSHFVETRTVIIKQNYKKLDGLLEFIYKSFRGLNAVVLIFHELEGQCGDHLKRVGITYQDVESEVAKSIRKWAVKINDLRLYHFPLCALPSDLWPHAWRTLPATEVSFPKKCSTCLYKKYCMGIHNDYLRLIGDKEFEPIRSSMGAFKMSRGQDFIYHPIVAVKNTSKS